MRPHKRTHRNRRQHTPDNQANSRNSPAWNRLVDALAMHLCPTTEWQAYEKKVQYLIWKSKLQVDGSAGRAKVCAFPVWRKYRQQAQKIASLHQVVPLLRHLPLPVSSFLGRVFF